MPPQLPGLLGDIASGTREFTPSPEDARESVCRMYRARRTLVLRFDRDGLDESEELRDLICASKEVRPRCAAHCDSAPAPWAAVALILSTATRSFVGLLGVFASERNLTPLGHGRVWPVHFRPPPLALGA